MTKTGKEIQGDVLELLKSGSLASAINGGVYRSGYRPRDSRLEDAVVIFTAGLADQIQTGVITVNVYFPDIELNGVWVEDGVRGQQLERAAQDWVNSLTCGVSNYRFGLQASITTEPAQEIQQHFVVIMLRYRYFDE